MEVCRHIQNSTCRLSRNMDDCHTDTSNNAVFGREVTRLSGTDASLVSQSQSMFSDGVNVGRGSGSGDGIRTGRIGDHSVVNDADDFVVMWANHASDFYNIVEISRMDAPSAQSLELSFLPSVSTAVSYEKINQVFMTGKSLIVDDDDNDDDDDISDGEHEDSDHSGNDSDVSGDSLNHGRSRDRHINNKTSQSDKRNWSVKHNQQPQQRYRNRQQQWELVPVTVRMPYTKINNSGGHLGGGGGGGGGKDRDIVIAVVQYKHNSTTGKKSRERELFESEIKKRFHWLLRTVGERLLLWSLHHNKTNGHHAIPNNSNNNNTNTNSRQGDTDPVVEERRWQCLGVARKLLHQSTTLNLAAVSCAAIASTATSASSFDSCGSSSSSSFSSMDTISNLSSCSSPNEFTSSQLSLSFSQILCGLLRCDASSVVMFPESLSPSLTATPTTTAAQNQAQAQHQSSLCSGVVCRWKNGFVRQV